MAALLAATVFFPRLAPAQMPMGFLGFRPGASQMATARAVRELGGSWSCRRSTVDARFSECRGRIAPDGEPALSLIGSLIRDSVAVLLLSGTASESDLARWQSELDRRIGPATIRQSQGQVVWQWIRSRRMIRITARAEGGRRVASISLVDGVLLDGLEEPRAP